MVRWSWEGDGEAGDAVVRGAAFKTDVCGCGHSAFVYFCSFALCVLLSMPHGHDRQKSPLLLFTAGHSVCGTVHQAKSHRLVGGAGIVWRFAVSYRK